ncbi:hypothetical protein [Flammeovirga sp. EKP202]|uniref:hypothetical protein n=1 Tax=Flammeovirga sp. EKP202 TaxID=2770592 RepID=UPI00165ECE49|nr:hypothetical protein [Flammeovirga sp. EKP202]MBD0403109.1 hypothetical protein [Flammeovirga sp. EKP202]
MNNQNQNTENNIRTILRPLLRYLEDKNIQYSIVNHIDTSPYSFISIPSISTKIHFINPTKSFKKWHTTHAITSINSYFKEERIIHLWADTWHLKQSAVLSRVAGLLGYTTRIHARTLKVKRIDIHTLNEFIESNHISGSPSSKIKLGLFQGEKLVAVASFSGKRKINDRDGLSHRSYELIRYCNLNDHTVVGGLSKLLKYFIKEYSPDDIMTYTDSDWSAGESFTKLGFEKMDHSVPIVYNWNDALKIREKSNNNLDAKFPVFNAGSNKYILNLNRINN